MIPVSKPIIPENAKKYVLDCLEGGWISGAGPQIDKFENNFAEYLGIKYAVASSSGTAALHLALAGLGIKKGDEVIVPAFTMIAPLFTILYVGATPVLVDSEKESWNINPELIESKITRRTKAIIVVHTYGHPADLNRIKRIAEKHKLIIIEDAAEALGAEYNGKKAGTIGEVGCFSLYANKTITTGEGGMVVTNGKNIAERLRSLRNMAHSPNKRFSHGEVGFSYRMTNLQAALGLSQISSIETTIKKKRSIAHLYNLLLRNIRGLTLPIEKAGIINIYWMYGLLVEKNFGITRDEMRKKLFDMGIDTRDFFVPMNQQPALKKLGLFKNEHYPIAEAISRKGLYLPSGPNISNGEIEKVVRAIKQI